jgi:hypothetical protein
MPPLDQIQSVLLNVMLPPAIVAAVLMACLGWFGRRSNTIAYLASATALAVAIGVGGWWSGNPLPLTQMPGTVSREWLPWATLAALVIGDIATLPKVPAGLGWSLRGLMSAHAGWLLTPGGLRSEYFWVPLVLGAVVFAVWAVLEQLDWGGLVALAAFPVAVTAATVLIHAGSLSLFNLPMMLAGSLAGVGLAALALRVRAAGVAPATAMILPPLLLAGWYETYSAVPKTSFALAALAPLTLAASLLPAWQRRQKKGLWAVQIVLLLLPLAGAVALAALYEPFDQE